MYFDQRDSAVRFEWGLSGLEALAPVSDVVIIVDVLSFTTAVDVVVGAGGMVFPYRGSSHDLPSFALANDAQFVSPGRQVGGGYSLSPASLLTAPPGIRLVLPSLNGSTLSLFTGNVPTLAGCLRNAAAVARHALAIGSRISVIAAGERWPRESLRPGLEDLLGAGAIIAHLTGHRSPEADLALGGFEAVQTRLPPTLARCSSGKELIGRGFRDDVEVAAMLNVSDAVPQLVNGAYVDATFRR